MSRRFAMLRQALTEPGDHLDETTLAEIASAEAAGEAVEQLYAAPLQHIETCLSCAETYGELVEMMLTAVAGMSEAAAAVPPLEVYTTLILHEVASRTTSSPTSPALIREVVETLPLFLAGPMAAGDVNREAVLAAVQQSPRAQRVPTAVIADIAEAVSQNLSALSIYLSGLAGSVWGKAVQVSTETTGRWHALQLTLSPPKELALLSSQETGEAWHLFNRKVGRPLPVQIEVRAERLSPLACRLIVRVDRPGLADAGGRLVELTYQGHRHLSQTDKTGIAHFSPIPIAAIPHVTLLVSEGGSLPVD